MHVVLVNRIHFVPSAWLPSSLENPRCESIVLTLSVKLLLNLSTKQLWWVKWTGWFNDSSKFICLPFECLMFQYYYRHVLIQIWTLFFLKHSFFVVSRVKPHCDEPLSCAMTQSLNYLFLSFNVGYFICLFFFAFNSYSFVSFLISMMISLFAFSNVISIPFVLTFIPCSATVDNLFFQWKYIFLFCSSHR